MQKTQLAPVLSLVAEIDGDDPVRDRKMLLRRINSTRQLLWKMEAFREGACVENGCSVVELFREPCRNCSCRPVYYTGIVFPPLVTNIREIMKDGREVQIQYARIHPQGCGGCWDCLIAEELPTRLLERDIPWDSNKRVVFRGSDPLDNGLTVGVRYMDYNGHEQREDLELHEAGVVTSVSVMHFLEITFPDRCGWIEVTTEEGDKLGRYHPSINSPTHQHFRVNGTQCGDNLHWKALRERYNLVFDTDEVEFSDDPTWTVALALQKMVAQVDMTPSQRAGQADLTSKLSGFFTSDLSAQNKSFHGRVMPRTRMGAMGTAMLFGRPTYGVGRRGWR